MKTLIDELKAEAKEILDENWFPNTKEREILDLLKIGARMALEHQIERLKEKDIKELTKE